LAFAFRPWQSAPPRSTSGFLLFPELDRGRRSETGEGDGRPQKGCAVPCEPLWEPRSAGLPWRWPIRSRPALVLPDRVMKQVIFARVADRLPLRTITPEPAGS